MRNNGIMDVESCDMDISCNAEKTGAINRAPTQHAMNCGMGVMCCGMIYSINIVETGDVFCPF